MRVSFKTAGKCENNYVLFSDGLNDEEKERKKKEKAEKRQKKKQAREEKKKARKERERKRVNYVER